MSDSPSKEYVAYAAGPSTMRDWLADQILAWLQKRCQHPGNMVAVDILEGCSPGLEVAYCRRCGSVKIDWQPGVAAVAIDGPSAYSALDHTWRRPDPNLWRGK